MSPEITRVNVVINFVLNQSINFLVRTKKLFQETLCVNISCLIKEFHKQYIKHWAFLPVLYKKKTERSRSPLYSSFTYSAGTSIRRKPVHFTLRMLSTLLELRIPRNKESLENKESLQPLQLKFVRDEFSEVVFI